MSKTKAWIHAFRLRTLPLSLSSIILGSLVAASDNKFSSDIFILAILTTLFLQILSNLANDLGDSISGADNNERIGPERAIQSGIISKKEMKNMLYVFIMLSLVSGSFLIYKAAQVITLQQALIIFAIGILAILAAINYTIGKNPYGYMGFGDLFVFIFFGLVGTLGSYFLHTGYLQWDILLPAASIGLLSTGVLNLNNLRDIENDSQTGKKTLVVKIGSKAAKNYHLIILALAMLFAILYSLLNYASIYQFIYLLTFPLILRNIKIVLTNKNPRDLDPELKILALSCFFFSLSFGLGTLL
ncbi:1,4-dihydroxy-2-naphthoate polyprenyltransferase [Ancylomarina sp. 16SWW S1-10-2]|uniref:1,4-dihydroxy-2-naphthoate polyprenyltransferase n=1 Tax=Ancylomarina sp. 16SWW S1-10-2 TaxID=2499681 RepID=UPI0012ADCD58|nr:1,4-dihydroxy-2-naphthoate polyprenyltransferase [Ancylomarina sp. 16SWW S1-10-2]MRT92548.1 1,4-dihydroxy-2-naphthoate polyprenyltransferase [Ancylomarina sp. 16SWW S1-10-2]